MIREAHERDPGNSLRYSRRHSPGPSRRYPNLGKRRGDKDPDRRFLLLHRRSSTPPRRRRTRSWQGNSAAVQAVCVRSCHYRERGGSLHVSALETESLTCSRHQELPCSSEAGVPPRLRRSSARPHKCRRYRSCSDEKLRENSGANVVVSELHT